MRSDRKCPYCKRPYHGCAGQGVDCKTNAMILRMSNKQFAELNKWMGVFFPGMKLVRKKV